MSALLADILHPERRVAHDAEMLADAVKFSRKTAAQFVAIAEVMRKSQSRDPEIGRLLRMCRRRALSTAEEWADFGAIAEELERKRNV